MTEQKKNKGSVLIAESAYNSQIAQFGRVMLWYNQSARILMLQNVADIWTIEWN